jgi:hypothetical protein
MAVRPITFIALSPARGAGDEFEWPPKFIVKFSETPPWDAITTSHAYCSA